MPTALVLSGGGLLGAWQAGAWSVLRETISPDLVVGVSIGSLNGYLIASGIANAELRDRWLDPRLARLTHLAGNIRAMMDHYHLRIPFAITATDLLTLKPRVFRDSEITWRHLAASCAVPLVLPQRRLDGRWYSDGGLVDPLPIRAALDLGATRIVALDALPGIRSRTLRPIIRTFRRAAGFRPIPDTHDIQTLAPTHPLAAIRETLIWKQANIEAWWSAGVAQALSLPRRDSPETRP